MTKNKKKNKKINKHLYEYLYKTIITRYFARQTKLHKQHLIRETPLENKMKYAFSMY